MIRRLETKSDVHRRHLPVSCFAGMTLLEVLLAAFLVTVLALGLGLVLSRSLQASRNTYDLSTASDVASSVIEDYKALFSVDSVKQACLDSALAHDSVFVDDTFLTDTTDTIKGVIYKKRATFYYDVDNGLRVTAAAVWKDVLSHDHSVKMSFIFE